MIRVVASQHEFYVPTFKVMLGSGDASEIVRDVTQVTYKDGVDQISSFQLTINNWDARTQTLKYTDRDLLDPGQKIELRMGYRGKNSKEKLPVMIRGKIKSLRYSYPASGGPTVSLSGLNILDELQDQQQNIPAFKDKTVSEIASEIIGKRGLEVQTDPDKEKEKRKLDFKAQSNKTDLVFLKELAESVGYELVVIEEESKSKIYFGPQRNINEIAYELVYGAGSAKPAIPNSRVNSNPRAPSLIQFNTTLNTTSQKSKVEYFSTHPKERKNIKAVVDRNEIKPPKLNDTKRQEKLESLFANRIEKIDSPPVETEDEAEDKARGAMDKIAREMITGSGSTIGLPDLRSGVFVQIDGIGEHFKGKYFVTSATHSLGGGGYTTQFECRRQGE